MLGSMIIVSTVNLISTANFDRFRTREESDGEPRVDARGAVPLRAAADLLLVVDGTVLADANVGGEDARTDSDRRGGAQGEQPAWISWEISNNFPQDT